MIRRLPLPALRFLDRAFTRAVDLVLAGAVVVQTEIDRRAQVRCDAERQARSWRAIERRIATESAARAAGVSFTAKGGMA